MHIVRENSRGENIPDRRLVLGDSNDEVIHYEANHIDKTPRNSSERLNQPTQKKGYFATITVDLGFCGQPAARAPGRQHLGYRPDPGWE